MRILFIAPYPPSQIRIRSYGFLNQLKYAHEVTVLVQVASRQEMADVEVLRQQGYKIVAVMEASQKSAWRSGLALLGSQPLQAAYARSKRFLREAQQLCDRQHFDVIHVEHLRGMASMERLATSSPLVWDAVDCISQLWKQAAVAGPSLSVRAVAALEYRRTQNYEARLLRQCARVLTTSERDRQALLELCDIPYKGTSRTAIQMQAAIDVVPCGVDLTYFRPLQHQQRLPYNIVFSGKLSYHANVAAALYLYEQIMPLIWQQQADVTLTLVGCNPPAALKRLAHDPRVELTGYVDDLRPYIRRAQVMLSPMVYSVGLQNKVLEAMALGTPTVVAARAAAAMSIVAGRDLLIAHSAQEFAERTLSLLRDPALHAQVSRHGRMFVEQQHDWHMMADRLTNVYKQVMATYKYRNSQLGIARQLVPDVY